MLPTAHRTFASETKENSTNDTELSETEKKLIGENENLAIEITNLNKKNDELLVSGNWPIFCLQ